MSKADRKSLTAARLRGLLSYDPETGAFHWLVNRRGCKTKAGERADARVAGDGQRYITIDGSIQSASRLAWLWINGTWPKRPLRHRDDDSANNAIGNLFEAVGPAAELAHGRLLEMLSYDEETGIFTWRRRVSNVAAGSVAGHIIGAKGYRYIRIDNHDYTAQQLAWFYVAGEFPVGKIFFKDQDVTNIRFANLREPRGVEGDFDMSTAEGRRAYDRARRAQHQNAFRDYEFRRSFGITLEQYQEMLAAQNGVCAICHQPETGTRNGMVKWLAVDHDHETNVVRGLLCVSCNTTLGKMGDNAALLRAAADYLDRHAALAAEKQASNVIPLRSA